MVDQTSTSHDDWFRAKVHESLRDTPHLCHTNVMGDVRAMIAKKQHRPAIS